MAKALWEPVALRGSGLAIATGNRGFAGLVYELALVTEHHRPVLTPPLLAYLEPLMGRLLAEAGGDLLGFSGGDDWVQILVRLPASLAPAAWVNSLKGVTSRLVRRDYPDEVAQFYARRVLWAKSYAITTRTGTEDWALHRYRDMR